MAAAKHLLRYIQGTLDYAFTYAPSEHNSLYGLFADFEDFSLRHSTATPMPEARQILTTAVQLLASSFTTTAERLFGN